MFSGHDADEFASSRGAKSNCVPADSRLRLDVYCMHGQVKAMNQLMLYAKCVTIRDKQKEEKEIMKRELEAEEKRLAEVARLEAEKAAIEAAQRAAESAQRAEAERQEQERQRAVELQRIREEQENAAKAIQNLKACVCSQLALLFMSVEKTFSVGLLRHVEIRQKCRKCREQNWCRNVEKCREQNVATYRHVVFENVEKCRNFDNNCCGYFHLILIHLCIL